jgi:hypothetical protein
MSNDNAIVTGSGACTLRQSRVRSRGLSLHEESTYYVIRPSNCPAQREEMKDTYYNYSSDDWRQGPREAMLALMEDDTDIVLQMDNVILQGLRRKR